MRLANRGVASFTNAGRDILFQRGSGGFVTDQLGSKYLDLVCGYGPVVIGHGDEQFRASIDAILSRGVHFPGFSTLHQEYAAQLPSLGSDSAVVFFKTSSEAMSAALRVAAIRTGYLGVVRCGFLGWHDAQLSTTTAWHEPLNSPVRRTIGRYLPMRGVSGAESVRDWDNLSIESLVVTLDDENFGVGAAAIDTYQSELVTDTDLLKGFASACRDRGVVSILDETKTSGRLAPLGFSGDPDILPDFLIAGKAIANGAPLSLLVVREYDSDELVRARVGGTHSKELSGIAAALATSKIMKERDGYSKLRFTGVRIIETLNEAAARAQVSSLVSFALRLEGTAFDVLIDTNIDDYSAQKLKLRNAFIRCGILLLVGHPSFFCLAHDEVDKEWLFDASVAAFSLWRSSLVDGTTSE